MTTRLTVAIACSMSLSVVSGHAQQIGSPTSEVRATVVDESSALVSDCKVVFRNESETVASRTGRDGSVTVRLPSGKYTLKTSRCGFGEAFDPITMSDIQIVAPVMTTLRVVVKLRYFGSGSPVVEAEGPVPIPPDLPMVIEPEPSRATDDHKEPLVAMCVPLEVFHVVVSRLAQHRDSTHDAKPGRPVDERRSARTLLRRSLRLCQLDV